MARERVVAVLIGAGGALVVIVLGSAAAVGIRDAGAVRGRAAGGLRVGAVGTARAEGVNPYSDASRLTRTRRRLGILGAAADSGGCMVSAR